MSRYLSAELLRSRHTALQWLPLTALPLVGLTYNLAAFVNSRTDAVGVLMWQAVYLTGIAAPLTALFAAAAENREKKSNYGGTLWLPLSRKRLRATRLGVILLSLAIFHVLNFGGTWLLLTLSGRSGSERIAVLGLYAYIGTIGIAGLASALTRLTNFLITFLVFTAWQIVGITKPLVEGDHWWIWPMTWPVRLVLPILGVHQNAVPLEPGSPLNKESPAGALILCGVLALLGLIAATLTPESWQVQKKKSPTVSPSTALKSAQFRPALLQRTAARKPRPYSALTLAALTPTVRACLLLSIAALILCTLIYPILKRPGFSSASFTALC
ncbi:MAG TPA: hypothetical protein H9867_01775 [Candidatus Corynebacterium gallistercoris]|uniref:Lantibiotic ABC transporter permease n=1 Tax=Candidatus Corynebacterium gallistercoris TaxID=2838530 RepID=A0A9D1UQF9_9CORY|nr:hypothetical protein [Candidatus Corynebacterium gallistercoris]